MPSEEEIFSYASKIVDTVARSNYLAKACDGDRELRASIEELLAIHDTDGQFLETPALKVPASQCELEIDRQLGPYRILERMGEGGFGIVYRAKQEHPIQREVALKVLKPGMDSNEILRRFQFEKQALAAMSHANIASIYDAGVTKTDRPYFVMEYFPGVDIDRFCDDQRLSIQQRIQLVLKVCDAVQHAHQKGIVHRDLKPSNVLVNQHQGHVIVKVIDFGIAKALTCSQSSLTAHNQVIGTPEYMSPEQRGDQSDVDTRADIYSLGAMLFKLIVGTSPFVASKGTDSNGNLLRPSLFFKSLAPSQQSSTAMMQQTREAKLYRLLNGDLDWITTKAMSRDPAERYQTIKDFSEDLHAYLEDRAVVAGPPSIIYRTKKLLRRNPATSFAIVMAVLSLLMGGIASTIGFWQATQEGKRAFENWKNAVKQREIAETEHTNAESVSRLLEQLLGAADPDQGHGANYTVREMLNEFSDNRLVNIRCTPEVESKIRRTIGRSYWNLGDLARAGPNLQRALSLRLKHYGAEHFLTVQSSVDHAVYLFWTSRVSEADRAASDAVKSLSKQPATEELAWAQLVLSGVHKEYGENEKSRTYIIQAAKSASNALGPNHPTTISMNARVAFAYSTLGKLIQADKMSLDALDQMLRIRPDQHVNVAFVKRMRARVLQRCGRLDEAEQLISESVETNQKILGFKSNKVVMDLVAQSQILQRNRRFDEAIKVAKHAAELAEETTVQRDILRTRSFRNLAIMLEDEDLEEAATAWEKAVASNLLVLGEHPEVARMLQCHANVLRRMDQHQDAIDCLRSAVKMVAAASNEELTRSVTSKAKNVHVEAVYYVMSFNLIDTLIDAGNLDDAGTYAEQVYRQEKTSEGEISHAIVRMIRARLALAQGELDTVAELLNGVEEAFVNEPSLVALRIRMRLIQSELKIQEQRFLQAEEDLFFLVRMVRRRSNVLGNMRYPIAKKLVKLYEHWGKPKKAERWRLRSEQPNSVENENSPQVQ